MRIMVIAGSLRPTSGSRVIARHMAAFLRKLGTDVDVCDLSQTPLPFFTDSPDDPDMQALRDRAAQADGFFVASPEYHGGPGGALKNAIDLLDIPQFQGKPVALGVMAGGPKGGMTTLVSLRNTFRALMAWVMPEQVAACEDDFDEQMKLKNPAVAQRLAAIAKNLIKFGQAFKQVRESDAAK